MIDIAMTFGNKFSFKLDLYYMHAKPNMKPWPSIKKKNFDFVILLEIILTS